MLGSVADMLNPMYTQWALGKRDMMPMIRGGWQGTAHFSCKITFSQLQGAHRYSINLVTSTVWISGSLGDIRLKFSLTKINLVRKSKTGKSATMETH